MNIILMRHGEAVPFAPNDGDRVLTPNGKGEASNTGTQLKKAVDTSNSVLFTDSGAADFGACHWCAWVSD